MMKKTNKGIGLVEVVVSAAIVTLVVLGLISAYSLHFRAGVDSINRIRGTLLAEEGIEVMKYLRNESWMEYIASLSPTETYYLSSELGWEATTTPQDLGVFTRILTASSVYRDNDGNIVSSGGVLDSGTRLITVSVSWPIASGTSTKAVSTYLTNLFNN